MSEDKKTDNLKIDEKEKNNDENNEDDDEDLNSEDFNEEDDEEGEDGEDCDDDDDEEIEYDEEDDDDEDEDEEIEYDIGDDDENGGYYDEYFENQENNSKNFKVYDVEELINKQQNEVIHTSEVLGIPVGVAGTVLRKYKFKKEKLFEEFFEDKNKCCKVCGINLSDYDIHKGTKSKTYECNCCYEDYPGDKMFSLSCKHLLCGNCWKEYLTVKIKSGPSCLTTKCPYPKCDQIITETIVKQFTDEKNYKIYRKYLSRSFVDENPNIRWCPKPDCGKAIYCPDLKIDVVECSCGHKFCFQCSKEAHAPVSCKNLTEWLIKEKDESETSNYLTANTKNCPECQRPIEKNGGCNHMTCSLCKYEFCWVCMDSWKKHDTETGGFYKCNRFSEEELKKKLKDDERNEARLLLERYMHYYQRYANHNNSQKHENKLNEKMEIKMKQMQSKNKYSSWVDVEFIQKAVDQLIECRRSLKYTYVYAFYLKQGKEQTLFEYLQEDLERTTEKLSEILEAPIEKFDRDKIIATTKSAEKRLSHLLKGVQKGLIIG